MIRLHYGPMFSDRIGERGLPRSVLEERGRRFAGVHADVEARRASGEYGFYALDRQHDVVAAISTFADGLGQAFDHVIVLGIGGSALGAKMLLEALRPPTWNELTDEARSYYPRLTVLDNIDPTVVAATLERIDPRRVLVSVVSKSGSTAETMAQYLCVREWLEDAVGGEAARGHFVFITDPERGALRQLAVEEGIPALDIPKNVGGRFSVLSPVGLLPAALVGIDIGALVRGAGRAVSRGTGADLLSNPPALYAALQHAADVDRGAHIHVLMPYSDRLRQLGGWFRQLWAESLGKAVGRDGSRLHAGPTPVSAVGVTDQHSQVQLFVEGPFDKTVTFVSIEEPGVDLAIPQRDDVPEAIGYLGGHSLGELMATERAATMEALASAGRMHCLWSLPTLDAEHLGELIMSLQIATVHAGSWYGVDPQGQPGVERGKQLTYGAMGRAGFEPPALLPKDEDYV